MTSSRRIEENQLRCFVTAALEAVEMSTAHAEIVADALVTTDAMGVLTHGTKLLAGYLRRMQGGGYQAQAEPTLEREGPSWAVLNGQSNLGQIGCAAALKVGMKKASQTGVAYVGLTNTGHIGAAGYFAQYAARKGFITMVTGNDMPSVAGPGTREPVLGSNPIAYAVPVDGQEPIVFDIATAAVAGGKVYAATQRGESIPDTWLVDRQGQPTTDGTLYPYHASLAPMAGHKGYGIGLWCELMSAVLPSGLMTWQVGSWIFDEPSKPSGHNASFTFFDANLIGPQAEFSHRLKHLMAELHDAPTAEGVDQLRLPGEREWECYREAQEKGIELPEDVLEKLREAAELTGVSLP
jgi:ureidoglycolate dehydrogenase (NAD+)